MGAHRVGKVWGGKGVGWLKKQEEQDAQYENLGDGWPLFIAICRFWPDFLADILWSDDAPFSLTLIQRMILRINARYRDVDITGCRGLTKSFCTDLGEYLDMLLWPGITGGIFGPTSKQTAKIAREIYKQMEINAPALTDMLTLERDGDDIFIVTTPYGSKTSIEAFRGNTMHKVVAEETAQEDKKGSFPVDDFKEAVVPQVRAKYAYNQEESPAYINYKHHSITSAGRRTQYAFEQRERHRKRMKRGESAFVIDVGVTAVLLCQIRDVEWVEKQKDEVGIFAVPRELESIYSGNEKNPLIPEDHLESARCLAKMENRHCCNFRNNKLKPEDVIYIVGYDVSYRDSKKNAKCAAVVVKCTKQEGDWARRTSYLKQVVWVEDWTPAETPTPIAQAQRLRAIWNRYCYPGSQAYIAIDAWQYGDGVLTSLMDEQPDGSAPICCYDHCDYRELEQEGAVPVIYPIRAGGVGTTNADSDMIKNMQGQFRSGNIQLLTASMNDGVEQYKLFHRIKDDSMNARIAAPYKKTNELCRQIENLREQPAGQSLSEKRISNSIQRDSWSALKYAVRFAQVLERENLVKKPEKNEWQEAFRKLGAGAQSFAGAMKMRGVGRVGGRRY